MSSAFDTIHRDKLIEVAEEILDEDEVRILRLLLTETKLEAKIENAEANVFESNIGSPQGDSISGPLFTIYFNNALKQLRNEILNEPIDIRKINQQWIEKTNSSLPEMMIYADDCDFITELEDKKKAYMKKHKKY